MSTNHKMRTSENFKLIKQHKYKIDPQETENIKKICQDYVDNDWHVTPLYFKAAYLTGWSKLRGEEIFTQDWYKGANGMGVLCGKVNKIICLDLDFGEDDRIWPEIKDLLPKENLVCRRGNPTRLPSIIFKYNGEDNKKFNNIGVEILSDGAQFVYYGEHDKYQKSYERIGKELIDVFPGELPELSKDLLKLLSRKNAEAARKEIKTKNGTKQSFKTELVQEKGRCAHNSHNVLSMFGVFLCKQDVPFEFAVIEVLKKDETINSESDFIYFECPTRKEFKGLDKKSAAYKFVLDIYQKHSEKEFEPLSDDLIEAFEKHIENGFTYITDKGRVIRKIDTLYRFLRALHNVEYVTDLKMFAIFDKTHYKLFTEDFIKCFAQKYYNRPVCTLPSERKAFIDYVKSKRICEAEKYNHKYNGKVNFLNGVYEIETGEFRERKHGELFMNVIPHNYSEDNNCPTWMQFLVNVSYGVDDRAILIEEYLGWILSGAGYDKFNHFLILDGGGSNGKSTLIRIMQELIGSQNISSTALEKFSEDRFAGYTLFNKLVNFCSETHKKAFKDTGPVKTMTGGDPINVEKKQHGAFSAMLNAKLVISYNKMPYIDDDSAGMKRRPLIVLCEQDYEANPKIKIKDVEEKCLKEASAIIERCLKAYSKVLERGSFTIPKDSAERFEEILTQSNAIKSFIFEYIELDESDKTNLTYDELYAEFRHFQGGKEKHTRRSFLKELRKNVSDALSEKFSQNFKDCDLVGQDSSGNKRVIKYVKFKNDADLSPGRLH